MAALIIELFTLVLILIAAAFAAGIIALEEWDSLPGYPSKFEVYVLMGLIAPGLALIGLYSSLSLRKDRLIHRLRSLRS